ncbi:hypothetical protein ABE65_017785 [Fictibacillus phosphorivorans]|uniref:Uncharacterized protein n=1 Tax=Fictibacillus phosphorivorans TaxID=1221500 RepID=A0A168W8J9_9BACL|nr:hypothetical protein [Fictibacillus phosphorivorans]ANC78549.1 hypothetical protein ABE65_017785 [Fictibacillus phosphorivorans]
MKEDNIRIYLNMILGTIGTILISLGLIRYLGTESDIKDYIGAFLGFTLMLGYIDYLEKKAGISRKLTWIRALVSIVFIFISYFIYY